MSVEVEITCSECRHYIDEDEVLCPECAKENKTDEAELLNKLAPYVSEATLMKPVEIPGELAFEIKMFLRGLEK